MKSTQDEKNIHIYSDASFSKKGNVAVTGFLLFENDASHIAAGVSQAIQTKVFKEKNNIRAELRGVIFALETTIRDREQNDSNPTVKDCQITLYTDCQTITRLPGRRNRLESTNFVSKRTKKSLRNADLYRRFFTIYDKVTPNLFWVKGHTAKKDRGLIQKNFNRVDKVVRDVLRRQTQISEGGVKAGGESGSIGGVV